MLTSWRVCVQSELALQGDNTFVKNTVGSTGKAGGMHCERGRVMVHNRTVAVFERNEAFDGGALSVTEGEVLAEGTAVLHLHNNTARNKVQSPYSHSVVSAVEESSSSCSYALKNLPLLCSNGQRSLWCQPSCRARSINITVL